MCLLFHLTGAGRGPSRLPIEDKSIMFFRWLNSWRFHSVTADVSVYAFLSQAKEKYEKSLEELNKCTPQYTESMEQVFDQCQQHEVKRLTFLKEALLDIKRHLNLTENQRLDVFPLQVLFMCQTDPGSQYNHRLINSQSPRLLSGRQ